MASSGGSGAAGRRSFRGGRLMSRAWLASLTSALGLTFAVGAPTSAARMLRAVNEGLIEAAERASASMLVVPSIVTAAALPFLAHNEINRLKDDLERPSEPDPEEIPGGQPTT